MKPGLVVIAIVFVCAISATSRGVERADSADSQPATSQPTEIHRGLVEGGTREERARRAYEQIIRKIEPSLVGDPDRLPQYLEFFKREFVEDTRTFAVNLSGRMFESTQTVMTGGWVEYNEHRKALSEFLKHLGFKSVNDVALESLPAKELGEKRFAIVGDSPVYIYDRATTPRETFTEALPGEALFLLKDFGDGNYLCHGPDGYVGYVEASKLRPVTGKEFDDYVRSRPRSKEANERVETAIATAQKYLGTKYVWGGRTTDGIDCSGLVHQSYRAAGVTMPRDADQQSLAGTLVATRWHTSSMRRGDVMFFLGPRGTISHTAIYLGDEKFIEATSPVVRITTIGEMQPGKDRPRGENFCFAKRVFE